MHKLKLILADIVLLMCLCIPTHAQTPTTTAKLVSQFGEEVYTLDCSPDGTSMVTGTVGISWDLGDGRLNDKPPVVQIRRI